MSRALEAYLIALSAEMLGGAGQVLDAAWARVKRRKVFGGALSHFQGVTHPLASVRAGVEAARALILRAARDFDRGIDGGCASLAKAEAADVFIQAAEASMHAHGAEGFTWDSDIHIHHKRALCSRAIFGAPSQHRSVVAKRLLDADPGLFHILFAPRDDR